MVDCNRCDKKFSPPKEYLEIKYETRPKHKSTGARVAYLCPECTEAFDNWMDRNTRDL